MGATAQGSNDLAAELAKLQQEMQRTTAMCGTILGTRDEVRQQQAIAHEFVATRLHQMEGNTMMTLH